jgi:hypothetical protein
VKHEIGRIPPPSLAATPQQVSPYPSCVCPGLYLCLFLFWLCRCLSVSVSSPVFVPMPVSRSVCASLAFCTKKERGEKSK